MGWPAYAIVAYVLLGLQVGMGRFLAIGGAEPNLAIVAVLFTALYARRQDSALLGCLFIGLFQDLLTGGQPGLYAFSYGLVAMFVRAAGPVVSRSNPLVHAGLALAGGVITMLVILLHSWVRPAGAAMAMGKTVLPATRISAGVELTRVVYSAAVAPLFMILLLRIRAVFVFQGPRRRR